LCKKGERSNGRDTYPLAVIYNHGGGLSLFTVFALSFEEDLGVLFGLKAAAGSKWDDRWLAPKLREASPGLRAPSALPPTSPSFSALFFCIKLRPGYPRKGLQYGMTAFCQTDGNMTCGDAPFTRLSCLRIESHHSYTFLSRVQHPALRAAL
jgi:hypothetical protein